MPPKPQKKPAIELILDTNAIFTQPINSFFAPEKFRTRIAKLREKADINICIPAPVFEEIVVQKTSVLQSAHEQLKSSKKSLNGFMPFECAFDDDTAKLKAALRDRIKSDSEKLEGKILPVDLGKPVWDVIVDAIFWRKGAFGKDDSSALKDAIICAVAICHAKATVGRIVVFLNNDNKASELELFSKEDRDKLIVLPSIEALEGLVENLNQESAAQFVNVRNLAIKRITAISKTMLYIVWELSQKFNALCGRDVSSFGLTSQRSTGGLVLWSSFQQMQLSTLYPSFSENHLSTELVSEADDGTFTFETKYRRIYNEILGHDVLFAATVERSEFVFLVTWTAKLKDGQLVEEALVSVTMPETKTSKNQVNLPGSGSTLTDLNLIGSGSNVYIAPQLQNFATGLSSYSNQFVVSPNYTGMFIPTISQKPYTIDSTETPLAFTPAATTILPFTTKTKPAGKPPV